MYRADEERRRCPTRKQQFPNEVAARHSCGRGYQPYKCSQCAAFHIYQTGTGTPDLCPIEHKITYLSEPAALEMAEELPQRWSDRGYEGMRPYQCPHYPHWHLGHRLSYVNWSRRHPQYRDLPEPVDMARKVM